MKFLIYEDLKENFNKLEKENSTKPLKIILS